MGHDPCSVCSERVTRPELAGSYNRQRIRHMTNHNATPPVQTFRDGSISVRIWKKEVSNAESTSIFFSIDMQRGYKQDDDWKNTASINGKDALKVANLFTQANNWIVQQRQSIKEGSH